MYVDEKVARTAIVKCPPRTLPFVSSRSVVTGETPVGSSLSLHQRQLFSLGSKKDWKIGFEKDQGWKLSWNLVWVVTVESSSWHVDDSRIWVMDAAEFRPLYFSQNLAK